MLTTETTKSLKHAVRAFPGTRIHFRLTGAETNGSVSVMDVNMLPGSEPPPHTHTAEDETIMVHSGEIQYFIGADIVVAKKGDVVFLPRNVRHHFKVLSAAASVTLIVTPSGFENFFASISFPFEGDGMPAVTNEPLTAEKIARIN